MVRTETPICEFDLPAIDFRLKGVDNQYYDLNSLKGENGLLIMFICNHCPYVKSIISRIIRDTSELKQAGINSVGIMSNDQTEYEEDSFENMKKIANIRCTILWLRPRNKLEYQALLTSLMMMTMI